MKIKSIYFSFLALLFFTGCEDIKFGNSFLEKPLGQDITIDTVYSNKKYAEQALAQAYHAVYDYLPQDGKLGWSMLEAITDMGESVKSGGTNYHKGSNNSSNTDGTVFALYNTSAGHGTSNFAVGLRRSWQFIENVDKVPDMTETEKKQRKAEAKALIGYFYVQAIMNMGGAPWIGKAYSASDDLNIPRETLESTVDKTCAILDEAAKDLPWSVNAEDDGRATAATALALKTRLLLFVASPLFNNDKPYHEGEASDLKMTWYGNYDKNRWQKALDAGLEFVEDNQNNNNFYKLVGEDEGLKMPQDFEKIRNNYASGYFDRYNKETLLSGRRFIVYNTNAYVFSQLRYGVCVPTLNAMQIYEFTDGTKFSWDKIGGNVKERFEDGQPKKISGGNPFFTKDAPLYTNSNGTNLPTRDPRMYETLGVNGDKYQGRALKGYLRGTEGSDVDSSNKNVSPAPNSTWGKNGRSGVGMRKFRRDWTTEVNGKFYSCPLIRLPEVYLCIAEAMNELGKANVADKFGRNAYDYINIVRNRVGMPNVDKSLYPEGEKLRNYILDERAREFMFEEVRYYDINRWKLDVLYTKGLDRIVITSNNKTKPEEGPFDYEYVRTNKYINNRAWLNDEDRSRYYLVPMPIAEVNKKYGLIQNPGWE